MKTTLTAATIAVVLGMGGCSTPNEPTAYLTTATSAPATWPFDDNAALDAKLKAEEEASLAELDVLKQQLLDDMVKVGPLAAECGAWDGDYWTHKIVKAEVRGNLPDGAARRFAAAWNDNVKNPDPVMSGLSCTMVRQMSLDHLVRLGEWAR